MRFAHEDPRPPLARVILVGPAGIGKSWALQQLGFTEIPITKGMQLSSGDRRVVYTVTQPADEIIYGALRDIQAPGESLVINLSQNNQYSFVSYYKFLQCGTDPLCFSADAPNMFAWCLVR